MSDQRKALLWIIYPILGVVASLVLFSLAGSGTNFNPANGLPAQASFASELTKAIAFALISVSGIMLPVGLIIGIAKLFSRRR
jgi:hypothetical protein